MIRWTAVPAWWGSRWGCVEAAIAVPLGFGLAVVLDVLIARHEPLHEYSSHDAQIWLY